jgi:hypothetical protein
MSTAQLDLLADEEMAVDATFATAYRIQLDATSWVEHIPDGCPAASTCSPP